MQLKTNKPGFLSPPQPHVIHQQAKPWAGLTQDRFFKSRTDQAISIKRGLTALSYWAWVPLRVFFRRSHAATNGEATSKGGAWKELLPTLPAGNRADPYLVRVRSFEGAFVYFRFSSQLSQAMSTISICPKGHHMYQTGARKVHSWCKSSKRQLSITGGLFALGIWMAKVCWETCPTRR